MTSVAFVSLSNLPVRERACLQVRGSDDHFISIHIKYLVTKGLLCCDYQMLVWGLFSKFGQSMTTTK